MNLKKNLVATALVLMSASAAQAAVVNSTIYEQIGGPTNVKGTTIDVYNITLTADSVLEIDMMANESLTGSLAAHPLALYDLNGDGEFTVMDGHMRLYKDGVEFSSGDDTSAYSNPGNINGWQDGTLSSRDSYMLISASAGNYTLYVADYNLQIADITTLFNTGDTLGNSQTHADYRLSILAFDDFYLDDDNNPVYGNELDLTVSQVPVPAAAWLFGSALMGFGAVSRRKRT